MSRPSRVPTRNIILIEKEKLILCLTGIKLCWHANLPKWNSGIVLCISLWRLRVCLVPRMVIPLRKKEEAFIKFERMFNKVASVLKYVYTLNIWNKVNDYSWNWWIVIPLNHSFTGHRNGYFKAILFYILSFSIKVISFSSGITIFVYQS